MKGIPDRWLPYTAMGKLVAGTRFVAFKVPLSEKLNKNLPEEQRFSPARLMELCPNLSLVVDLTNTKRYYNQKDFTVNSIAYEKIFCPGKQVPPTSLATKFNEIVDSFMSNNGDTDGVIGVHCTHGVNRTGYFICRYMIERMGIPADVAVSAFEEARGHAIERVNYKDDLKTSLAGGPPVVENRANAYKKNPGKYRRKANRVNNIGQQEHEENNMRMEWQNDQAVYQKGSTVNSGVDFGYEPSMPFRHEQPNWRVGNVRGGYSRGYEMASEGGSGRCYDTAPGFKIHPVIGYGRGRGRGYEAGPGRGYERGPGRGYETDPERGRGRGYETGPERGRGRGYKAGPERGRGRSYETGPERGRGRGYEAGPERDRGRGYETGPERGRGRGYETGPERGRGRGYETGPERGRDRGYETGPERGYETGPERGRGRGYEAGPERGPDRGYSIGSVTGYERGRGTRYGIGTNRDSSIGLIRSKERGPGGGYERRSHVGPYHQSSEDHEGTDQNVYRHFGGRRKRGFNQK